MRKLKLRVTDLEVASFAPVDGAGGGRGTVAGHKTDPFTNNGAFTCNGEETCQYASCLNTCGGTCGGGVCTSWPLTYCPQCGGSGALSCAPCA